MAEHNKIIVFDVDGTLCHIRRPEQNYIDVEPREDIVAILKKFKSEGCYIILYTSRQMNTYNGNIGKITAVTAKIMMEWLDKHEIPYDELHFGKPWCGRTGFYVDDKAVRPSEIIGKSFEDIIKMIEEEEQKI